MHGPVEPPIRRTALNSLHSKNNKTIKDGGISPWHWDHNCRYRPHRMIWTQGLRRTTKRNWLDQSYWEDCLVWSGLVWSQIHQKDQGFNNVGPGLLFSWSAMQRIAMLQSFEPLQILMLFKQSLTHWKLINLLSLDGKQEKMISRLAARWSETAAQMRLAMLPTPWSSPSIHTLPCILLPYLGPNCPGPIFLKLTCGNTQRTYPLWLRSVCQSPLLTNYHSIFGGKFDANSHNLSSQCVTFRPEMISCVLEGKSKAMREKRLLELELGYAGNLRHQNGIRIVSSSSSLSTCPYTTKTQSVGEFFNWYPLQKWQLQTS